MDRLLIVSNRLPVTVGGTAPDLTLDQSSGGLAAGLRPAHEESGGLWIGWPGELPRVTKRQRAQLDADLARSNLVPVYLTRQETRGYYDEISNGFLWPLFQYLTENLPWHANSWEMYRAVNERFARTVAEQYRPGDLVWIHDYHLLLVPAMLRRLIPSARIGFFLHITFPSDEVFSILPWREEILRGIMGADVIGFHTASYVRHFVTSLRRLLGLEVDGDRVSWQGRSVRLGIFPIGVNAAAWAARSEEEGVIAEADAIKAEAGGRQILLGIDRLDYTKGIPRRLLAFERVLEDQPDLHDGVRMIQVTVPTRERVDAYASLRRDVDEMVGRINGAHTTASAVPIHRLHQSLSERALTALYRAADVMLVTSLRDGMNLVAKEFVASRADGDGVLLLSEFAGAAEELGDALVVNPYDVEGMAAAMQRALSMPEHERRARMRAMRERVMAADAHGWTASFIEALSEMQPAASEAAGGCSTVGRVAACARTAGRLVLLLDYDGTLVPFENDPAEAAPDSQLLDLLWRLTRHPRIETHIISGRTRDDLDRWFGSVPVGLHAEHGCWSRLAGARSWDEHRTVSGEWKERVRATLDHFVAITPGSFIEEKTASIVWHYRAAVAGFSEGEDDIGDVRARELQTLLGEVLNAASLRVVAGGKAIEIGSRDMHKGALVPLLLGDDGGAARVLALGDDMTDEDLFAALPAGSITVKVGEGPTIAQHRVEDYRATRKVLASLLD